MKPLSLLILTLFCTIGAKAQSWIVPGTGNIYYNGGNVGIGTTSPGTLGTSITTLQIVGGSTIPSTRSGGWRLTSYDASLDAYGYFANSIFSVSYTHLRAHETDSYLVCRLLLEKKKKN